MGNLGEGFRPDEYEPDDDDDVFALLPDAWYPALCTEAELRPTNAGDGSFINCRWDIIESGRVVWSMITWENKNPKAKAIGRAQISILCAINGITDALTDTAQLVTENPVEIRVKTEAATDDFDAKNVVKRYRAPKSGVRAAASPSSKKGGAPAPAPDKKKKPWENKGA